MGQGNPLLPLPKARTDGSSNGYSEDMNKVFRLMSVTMSAPEGAQR